MAQYIEGKVFKKVDFSEPTPGIKEYEKCSFQGCNFSYAVLSNITFSDCSFNGCDFSLAKLYNTAFKQVTFKDCKLLGLHFEDCSNFLFGVSFEDCVVNLSTFFRKSLKKTMFRNCSLREVDFTESDLSAAVFENCDLGGAVFENSNLEKTDFRTSFNYSIDPEKNRVRKAKFSISGITGLLDKYDIEIDGI
ncbi:MAG: pentapeptide repeat-containing protein [Bacteroidetes bacterium]|nr:pentapeptide repeat-containing protein [Bacteroidota bacterium]